MTRLSAIVPATDAPPALSRCVEAIRNADEAPEELIVVESAAGPGPAAARNAGAEQANGDVLVFVDSDVLASLRVLRRLAGGSRRGVRIPQSPSPLRAPELGRPRYDVLSRARRRAPRRLHASRRVRLAALSRVEHRRHRARHAAGGRRRADEARSGPPRSAATVSLRSSAPPRAGARDRSARRSGRRSGGTRSRRSAGSAASRGLSPRRGS